MKSIKLPFKKGRILWVPDTGDAEILGSQVFATNLSFEQYRKGRLYEKGDLGSGLVTNVGVNFMADNDVNNRLSSGAINNFKYHAIGTGATAAAATDYYLQTPQGATNLSGTTNGYMTGTNTVVAPNQWKTIATFTATGAIAVTEWILAMSNAVNFSRTATGTPTATTFPDSGAAFTTAGTGLTGWTIEIASSAINTPTTTVAGLVTSNTATQLNIAEGWWTLANASGATPGANAAYVVYPTIFDHKQFAAINLANGDTLQFTYTNTINSGG